MAKYLDIPNNTAGQYADTPDAAANQIAGDLEYQFRGSFSDWTPGSLVVPFGKWTSSWRMRIQTSGVLTATNQNGGQISTNSTVGTGLTDDEVNWIKITQDVDNGAGGNDIKFYLGGTGTSPSYTQLGDTVTTGSTITRDTGGNVQIGRTSTPVYPGKYYELKVYDGIDGTLKVHFNAADFALGASDGATAVAATGETWTLHGAGVEIKDDNPLISNMLLLGVG